MKELSEKIEGQCIETDCQRMENAAVRWAEHSLRNHNHELLDAGLEISKSMVAFCDVYIEALKQGAPQ